jgi:HSP20 family protein
MTTVIWKVDPGSARHLPARRRVIVEAISWHVHTQSHLWSPPTDLYETENAYVVRVEIAGMHRRDFSVTLENNFLTVSATRHDTPERRAYHQMEVRFGEFSTVVALPGVVNAETSSAEYEDGFLIVTLPKAGPGHKPIKG